MQGLCRGNRQRLSSVGAAYTAAANGDIIEITDGGTYNEALTFATAGKNITIRSADGSPTATLTCTTANNTVYLNVASISVTLDRLNLKNASPSNNKAVVYLNGTDDILTMKNCVIDNTCQHGIQFNKQAGALTLSNCRITNNQNGTAVYLKFDTSSHLKVPMLVENCRFENNKPKIFEIADAANLTLGNSYFLNSKDQGLGFTNAAAGGSVATVSDCRFSSNTKSGLLFNVAMDKVTVTNCEFTTNGQNGIHFLNSLGLLRGSTPATIRNCNFTAMGWNGIFLEMGVTGQIDNCTFVNCNRLYNSADANHRDYNRGAICRNTGHNEFDPVNLTISNCRMEGCRASFLSRSSDYFSTASLAFTLRDNIFKNNWEYGLRTDVSKTTNSRMLMKIERNQFINTTARASALAEVRLKHTKAGSTFINNLIDSRGDVGLQVSTGPVDVYHNTFVNVNNAANSGAAFYVSDGGGNAIRFKNNLIDQSDRGSTSGEAMATVEIDYNLINTTGATADTTATTVAQFGTHNLTGKAAGFALPHSVPGLGNYRLRDSSSAINIGADQGVDKDLIYRLRPRPLGSQPDLGAYEQPYAVPVELSEFATE